MKDIIYCFVGESGSGKTTIAKMLQSNGFNVIMSKTTRAPREENEWGHIFASGQDYLNDKENDRIIAYTFYDGNRYWATEGQYVGFGKSIYVIDPAGVEILYGCVNQDATIIVVYFRCNLPERYNRLFARFGNSASALSRIVHDREQFKTVRAHFVIDSDGLPEQTLELVRKVIG